MDGCLCCTLDAQSLKITKKKLWRDHHMKAITWHSQTTFSVESCQSDVCEVKRDMIAIKHEIDSVQLVKDEIDEIRESLDRLEVESRRRKNKLLEQVRYVLYVREVLSIFMIRIAIWKWKYTVYPQNKEQIIVYHVYIRSM